MTDFWRISLAIGIGAYLSALGVAIKAFVRARKHHHGSNHGHRDA